MITADREKQVEERLDLIMKHYAWALLALTNGNANDVRRRLNSIIREAIEARDILDAGIIT